MITVGFSKTLKVSDATGKITWSSNKKTVATVTSKGKVTGKKAGSCTITAKTADGQKLTCKVVVKKNIYTDEKLTVDDSSTSSVTAYVYKALYNKDKGISCKVRVINNTAYQVTSLKNTKIVIKDANSKTVASYTLTSKDFPVSARSYKDLTIVIPSSSVKKAKANLRTSTVDTTGSYYYRY